MDKEISKSFTDELNNNNLSPKDIGQIFMKILNNNLSYLLQFKSLEEYIAVQKTLEFSKKSDIEDVKVIECYIASVILKSIEKGNMHIFEILIQNNKQEDKDLYKLMNEQCKI